MKSHVLSLKHPHSAFHWLAAIGGCARAASGKSGGRRRRPLRSELVLTSQ